MPPSFPAVPPELAERLRATPVTQSSFGWSPQKWLPVVAGAPEAKDVLQELPPRLDREVVRSVVQRQLDLDRGIAALVPVMIWGGPSGYGPFRTRAILTANRTSANWNLPIDPSVNGKLLEGARRAREGDATEAFRLMNNSGHIKYLGGSFFTKWISFASARSSSDAEEVAPILDKRVRDWIDRATQSTIRVNLSTTSTEHYARYLALLDSWRHGKDWSRSRAQVELAIFDLTRPSGGS